MVNRELNTSGVVLGPRMTLPRRSNCDDVVFKVSGQLNAKNVAEMKALIAAEAFVGNERSLHIRSAVLTENCSTTHQLSKFWRCLSSFGVVFAITYGWSAICTLGAQAMISTSHQMLRITRKENGE
jgi:hypothetical protein